jgi:hypothetical protein
MAIEMQIDELIKEAHQTAVEHGWWEPEKPLDEVLALIHSELSEALEEYRKSHGYNKIYYSDGYSETSTVPVVGCNKPEGIPVELADACIRIYDYIGCAGAGKSFYGFILSGDSSGSFPRFITSCHLYISYAFLETDKAIEWLLGLERFIRDYCCSNEIDLEIAIKIKMDYNKTRPYRHGGKKA